MKTPTALRHAVPVLLLTAAISLLSAQNGTAVQQKVDMQELMKNWSLFYEYHKNGEFATAAPYGWKVIQLDPKRFKAAVFSKLADCYFSFYQKDSTEGRMAYADTMLMIYDLGIEHVPDRAAPFWLSKGYALENYYTGREMEAITAYETAVSLDFAGTDISYIDRLGVLYVKNSNGDPSLRMKAIELYRRAQQQHPDSSIPLERLKLLLSDPTELVAIAEKDLARDPENEQKIWEAARARRDAEQWVEAEQHLQKLVKKSPKNATYWNELAKSQQRQEKYKIAISSYETSLKLDPNLRENHINITVCYRQMRNYSAAKAYALRTAQREKNWGQPYMELAEIYKAAVEQCVRESKGGDWERLDINDKLVYQLAYSKFERAKQVDPSLTAQANQRMAELKTLIPLKEDYFFHKDLIKDGKMEVRGDCYTWIDEAVAVPSP
jgi:tetratricopeptide (TPR) repeat protein